MQLRACRRTVPSVALVLLALAAPLVAQEPPEGTGLVMGRVTDAESGEPLAAVRVEVEGTELGALTDSTGAYRLTRVPPGPQVLRAERLGYAAARVPVTVPAREALVQNLTLAPSALRLERVLVTADPAGRARGELGTASVIGRDAIAHQPATTLAGVLNLVPGTPMQPPGLGSVQQATLRSAPTTDFQSTELAAFGTVIILDGVPLSNNANLHSPPAGVTGVRGAARGGIDLRRLPASTIERVEVIRGVPSARYGDLTQGAIIVDTRAGVVDPDLSVQFDARTLNTSLVAGRGLPRGQTATASADVTRYRVSPGVTDDQAHRYTLQLAHRMGLGAELEGEPRLLMDTRLDLAQVREDRALREEDADELHSWNRDRSMRLSHRSRLRLGEEARLHVTASAEHLRQRSYWQRRLSSGAMPFTDRLTEGQAVGRFIAGSYLAALNMDGDQWNAYTRLETEVPGLWLGFEHGLRGGVELRREWNAGPGYRFDMDRPPQISFNGIEGFDRPRRFDEIPPLATTALYLDDRLTRRLAGDMLLRLQAGLRWDLLHEGTHWASGVRDAVLQPRLNAELGVLPWLRLRGGWGRVAKTPTLLHLYPAPAFYDVINVNWYPDDPDERLAVLTTSILDRTNAELGLSRADKAEAGVEVGLGDSAFSLVAFRERISGGVGLRPEPSWLPRDRYAVEPTEPGQPPRVIEPPERTDTVPVLVQRPVNNTSVSTRGVELTALLPEIRFLRTRLELNAAWVQNEQRRDGIDIGGITRFRDFQLTPAQQRVPYWEAPGRGGRRVLGTYRIIHQQPELGLVVTATVQHNLVDRVWDDAATDPLAFAGYLTREGEVVPVPEERREDPEYADLRHPRTGLLVDLRSTPADWMMGLQVSKTLPLEGRLSFWAFNVLDRLGYFIEGTVQPRLYPSTRFGLELTMPLGPLLGGRP